MPMSPRLLRPRAGRSGTGFDTDAATYIQAVESADGQPLETAVASAINTFITGCKADGIWSAIKSSCLLMGARTLSGALTPLVGTAPTNNGFVSGDYNRKTGVVGDGSTKTIAVSRTEGDDMQDNVHVAAYVSTLGSGGVLGTNNANSSGWMTISAAATRSRSGTADFFTLAAGFVGHSRQSSSEYVRRNSGSSTTLSRTSGFVDVTATYNLLQLPSNFGNHRVAFYSVGSNINLALYDSRVTTLYNAIGAAIP